MLAAMASASDWHEIVRSAGAWRRLRRDPIPDDVVTAILEAAACAPSAMNLQPWRFVVTDEAQRARIGALYADAWQRGRLVYGAAPATRAEARMIATSAR